MQVGRVREIWRYPVKSMGGERLRETDVHASGLAGDRIWAVRDEVRGGIRGAKKIPALMQCAARLADEDPGAVPEILLPEGQHFPADGEDAAAKLSESLGHAVSLWPLQPADSLDHYRRGAPTHADVLMELRSIFGREPDEPLPNLSLFPPEVLQYESPPGTYFDAFPILLLTDASLRKLQGLAPASRVDVRRFRPNFVLETDPALEGFVEAGWSGRRIRIGTVALEATVPCPRCVMITHPQGDLPRDTGLMRTVVREAGQDLGLYARITTPGRVALGDTVELLD